MVLGLCFQRNLKGNFQGCGFLLIGMTVGQGPIVLAVVAAGVCLDIFLSSVIFFLFFLPLF